MKWSLAIGLPLIIILVWGTFFAPRSSRRLPASSGISLSLGLFVLAALALYQANQPCAGIALAVTSIVNRTLVYYWRQW